MDQGEALIWKATLTIDGVVQGVGFRPFIARLAREHGLNGFVRNEGGHVLVEAVGAKDALLHLIEAIETHAPKASRIIRLERKLEPLSTGETAPHGFSIVSSGQAVGTLFPTPDIAMCDDCRRELFTPGDPRFHNPFISCTHCGPRYTILKSLPYDRQNTAMDVFPLCELCAAQYGESSDRRYHAQTACCNHCGPELRWQGKSDMGEPSGANALAIAAQRLKQGGIVAVKGIGGFHFACDATQGDVVATLRTLKGREGKPFAVMFANLETLKQHCHVDAYERTLLTGAECPIVLLRRKANSSIASEVYTTSPYLGAFLPYTPLQHLLLAATGTLVMTSANPSGLPIFKDDVDMLRFVAENEQCEGVLYHNRAILRRLDDSVMSVVAGGTQFARRARGFVPLPIPYANEDGPAVLALGAQQKNTVCLSKGGQIYASTEIGDLDHLETMASYSDTIADMETLLTIQPDIAVCDLHPEYESTRFALQTGLPVLQVQHHFAHIASVLAEWGREEPVIGVAFDGTGYGLDSTVWGGEFLIASSTGFTRVGHLKPMRFVGLDESVRQGWKSAACMLYDAGLLDVAADPRYPTLKAALDGGFNTIRSSSMGRVFDAVSSMLGICHESTYEGQCAIELENAAALAQTDKPVDGFPFALRQEETGAVVDLASCLRQLIERREAGEDRNLLALQFHFTICQLIVETCVMLREQYGLKTVALSGGVFHNRILLENVLPMLARAGFETLINRRVPPGDGGISLGQAYVARSVHGNKEELCQCALPLAES